MAPEPSGPFITSFAGEKNDHEQDDAMAVVKTFLETLLTPWKVFLIPWS
jgi:hypothetical protein